MKKSGSGGNKTVSGLKFEKNVHLISSLEKFKDYEVKKNNTQSGYDVFFLNTLVARIFIKNDFYRFLEENRINWKSIISRKIIPDAALYVINLNTLFIFEIKYQEVPGSVDEKLQTCDFKRKQYIKLVQSLFLTVKYIYVLNEWFNDKKYKDVLDYVQSMNCHYVFNEVPLQWLGLPLAE